MHCHADSGQLARRSCAPAGARLQFRKKPMSTRPQRPHRRGSGWWPGTVSHALSVALLAGLGWLGGSAHAAPVTDRGSPQSPGQRRRMADVRARLPQRALQPARPDHARQRQGAAPGMGVLDRRHARRARGDAPDARWRALFLRRLRPGVRARRPHRHDLVVRSSRSTRRGSRPSSAAARSTAASR